MQLGSLLDFLFPPRDTERALRGVRLAPAPLLIPAAVPTVALLPYEDAARAAVIETKFHGNHHAARLLGEVLRDYLLEWCSEHDEHPILVPIPLSRERERERGYNQVLRIARAAGLNDIELAPHTLIRTRHTKAQTTKTGAARKGSMQGAFTAQSVDPARTYIVLDDVITTGATMSAAVEALREAGATQIAPLALTASSGGT